MWFALNDLQIHFWKIGKECGLSEYTRKEIRRQCIRQPDAHHGPTTGNGNLQLAETRQDTSHFLTNLLTGPRQLRAVLLARQQHFSASLLAAEFRFQVIDFAGHPIADLEPASLELLAKFVEAHRFALVFFEDLADGHNLAQIINGQRAIDHRGDSRVRFESENDPAQILHISFTVRMPCVEESSEKIPVRSEFLWLLSTSRCVPSHHRERTRMHRAKLCTE